VRILLNTNHPMFIWWGPDLIQFYNDAYSRTMGPERHPSALGQRGRTCWEEIWPIIGPQIEQVMSGGGATWHENQLVPVTRHGRLEQVYWTYGFSPSRGRRIGGVSVSAATSPGTISQRRRCECARRTRRVQSRPDRRGSRSISQRFPQSRSPET